jgi:hypothetical protein
MRRHFSAYVMQTMSDLCTAFCLLMMLSRAHFLLFLHPDLHIPFFSFLSHIYFPFHSIFTLFSYSFSIPFHLLFACLSLIILLFIQIISICHHSLYVLEERHFENMRIMQISSVHFSHNNHIGNC